MNKIATTVLTAALATGVVAQPVAAHAGSGAVSAVGHCSGSSSATIKAKHRDGRIEVEFEVDQNRNGVTWRVRLLRDGKRVWRGQRTTKAPSGSFTVERRIANGAGADKVTGRAVNPATGEVCRASVTV